MNCPSCGAAMRIVGNRRYFSCIHCGSYEFPEETDEGIAPTGQTVGAACPVCVQPLQGALIDGETVCYCGQCRGFLTQTTMFAAIVAKRRATHSPNEMRTEPFDKEELKRELLCPNCQRRMEAHPYYGGGNAVVDTCEACSLIWLDAGELAIIERHVPPQSRLDPFLLQNTISSALGAQPHTTRIEQAALNFLDFIG
jgi:Zn-finger nucleic acid-binding protein